jgi:DNA ligase (NAD+)
MEIQELKDLITKYDTAYRGGQPLVPDSVYDAHVDELITLIGEDDEFFTSSIKEELEDSERREKLPVQMASMNKAKTLAEVKNWFRLKKIPEDSLLIIMPKYDAISLLKDERASKAWTRGSKENLGLKCETHILAMKDKTVPDVDYTWGEAIISRANYLTIAENFDGDSPRNAAAGVFRRDYISDELQVVDFIKYGCQGGNFKTKMEQLDYLNQHQNIQVQYYHSLIQQLTEDSLKSIFDEFSREYEIDGLILELNDMSLWDQLGRERNGNPKYAIAYKGAFEEVKETKCTEIVWQTSKEGNLIPVAILEPVKLDNAWVSRVTLNNATFMKEMGMGAGAIVKVKRSGMVIPLITEVLTKMDFVHPNIECKWEGVHLKTLYETPEQQIKKLLSFFQILEVENLNEKTVELIYNSGYTTISSILAMAQTDLEELEGFGKRKAEIVYNAMHSKLKDIPLCKLQHATNIFKGLGSKKLALLEHFETKPSLLDVVAIEGFSDISAQNYLDGYDTFFEFVKDLPLTFKKREEKAIIDGKLMNQSFVFTGFRSEELEGKIIALGGKIGSGISKNVQYLIVKDLSSLSSKTQKAKDLGITILDVQGLENLLT